MSSTARPSGAEARATASEGSSFSLRRELARKALHLATALVPIGYRYGVPQAWIVVTLAVAGIVALLVERARRVHPPTRARFDAWFGPLLRAHEAERITGATWLCLSCLAAVALLPASAAITAMWCATMGDPAAAIVGRAFASPGGGKTWAGSAACLVVSALGAAWLGLLSPLPALAIGVTAALAERPAGPLDDNVRVTAATGLLALFLA